MLDEAALLALSKEELVRIILSNKEAFPSYPVKDLNRKEQEKEKEQEQEEEVCYPLPTKTKRKVENHSLLYIFISIYRGSLICVNMGNDTSP